jgi:murein DD-endopeptidase MepM/ murein hydrolase activator NlpD
MKVRKVLTSAAVLGAAAVLGFGLAWRAGLFNSAAASAAELAAVREAVARRAEERAFTEVYVNRAARELTARQGESFAGLLARAGASASDAGAALSSIGGVYSVRSMAPGQSVRLYFSDPRPGARLLGVAFRSAPGESVIANRTVAGDFRARQMLMPLTFEIARISEPVEGGLYATALRHGATDREINALAGAFAYDLDFQRDVRPGDHFELVFERFYDDQGNTVRTGDMLFISLESRRGPRAFYHFLAPGDTEPEWYDANGDSARRFLMKTPVNGARLSSNYGVRIHPMLGYSLMHRGVDFAAAVGTPILAAGEGVVERAGPFNSYGLYVKLRHGNGYETAYAHMSGIAAGIFPGARVRQGQIIGFVGGTGRATGPHLHYEVLRGGRQINPMSLQVPNGRNLSGRALELFEIESARIDTVRLERDRESPAQTGAATLSATP